MPHGAPPVGWASGLCAPLVLAPHATAARQHVAATVPAAGAARRARAASDIQRVTTGSILLGGVRGGSRDPGEVWTVGGRITDVAEALREMTSRDPLNSLTGCDRILVLGRTGSGKTTLARELAAALGVPHVELDSLYFGPDFSRADYREARERASETARATLGEQLWEELDHRGYLDVPSRRIAGLTYRLRVGRRIEVLSAPGVRTPWPYPFLCINPTYPLPEVEFFAQLYLYVRDHEDEIIRVAAPQPWDQALGRTF